MKEVRVSERFKEKTEKQAVELKNQQKIRNQPIFQEIKFLSHSVAGLILEYMSFPALVNPRNLLSYSEAHSGDVVVSYHIDLSGEALEGAYIISEIPMDGALFIRAFLQGATLKGNFHSCEFFSAELYSATLHGMFCFSNFTRADLREANLQKSDFFRACFSAANLFKANLQGANLESTRFAGWGEYKNANLEGADMRRANLKDCCFETVNLRKADLRSAAFDETSIFRYADLRKADMRAANLQKANFRKADCRGADFDGADLRHADLKGCELSFSNLENSKIEWNKLTQQNFSKHPYQSAIEWLRGLYCSKISEMVYPKGTVAQLLIAMIRFRAADKVKIINFLETGAPLSPPPASFIHLFFSPPKPASEKIDLLRSQLIVRIAVPSESDIAAMPPDFLQSISKLTVVAKQFLTPSPASIQDVKPNHSIPAPRPPSGPQ